MGTKNRYDYLPLKVKENNSKVIIEIGTWKARNAIKMINESLSANKPEDVYYYGFDLFEEMDQKTYEYEHSKWPPNLSTVEKELKKTGANIKLVKGNTLKTLPEFVNGFNQVPDLIYIDGGHSIDTIENDWRHLSSIVGEKTVVIFDDYYVMKDGKEPTKGCKQTIDSLDRSEWNVELLEDFDTFGDRCIYFVEVKKGG